MTTNDGTTSWTEDDRRNALLRAEREGVDLLVIGGGITGAGVLRDAASRGLRTLLVEREDFGAGTSSRSSKMVHGGLRYIAEGQLGVTRESCRERDRLLAQNPSLVRRVPFLFPSYAGGKHPLWQVRAALFVYSVLANFRRSASFRMLDPEETLHGSPDLRADGLRGAGLYFDAQVDDVRLVLETLKSARALGGEAVNHAELIELGRNGSGRLEIARVHDRRSGRVLSIRAHAFVNAAGPGVERVRGLDRPVAHPELRPAKGVHLVIPAHRLRLSSAVTFPGHDGRQLFIAPWNDVSLVGTTDDFSDEIDEPGVTIAEVHYLLSALNEAFPRVGLTTNDLRSVYAGVRPLVAPAGAGAPPSSVSREHRLYEDPSGLISMAGGKLTTYRAMGEELVDRALRQMPPARRAGAGPSTTARLPLRSEAFDPDSFERLLVERFGVSALAANHLVTAHGAAAERILEEATPEERQPIGRSRFVRAEIPFVLRTECSLTLCDLLERRMRLALFSEGQGLPELAEIASRAGEVLGWDAVRVRSETAAYADTVRRRYQIVLARGEREPARESVRHAAA